MTRYPYRPWYSPLGFMASAPTAYPPMMCLLALVAIWPLRYRISEYFERQRDGPHVELRHKAVKYYNEIERMHRRQALVNQQNIQDDNMGHRMTAHMSFEAIRRGRSEQEYDYWHAHQRDTMRAEKLLEEIRELKAKIRANPQ